MLSEAGGARGGRTEQHERPESVMSAAVYHGVMTMDPSPERSARRFAAPMSESVVASLLEEQPALLNLAQVADLLLTSPATVRRLVNSGSLPAVRLSRQWRVAREDLRQFLLTPSELDDETEPGETEE